MRYLLTCLAVALATAVCSTAYAGSTVDLTTTACTQTNICYNVHNDGGLTIDEINWSAHYERLTMNVVDPQCVPTVLQPCYSVPYDSGAWMVTGALDNVPLYAPDGRVAYLTVRFTEVRKPCVRSGKVTICPVVITLTDGTLEFTLANSTMELN